MEQFHSDSTFSRALSGMRMADKIFPAFGEWGRMQSLAASDFCGFSEKTESRYFAGGISEFGQSDSGISRADKIPTFYGYHFSLHSYSFQCPKSRQNPVILQRVVYRISYAVYDGNPVGISLSSHKRQNHSYTIVQPINLLCTVKNIRRKSGSLSRKPA